MFNIDFFIWVTVLRITSTNRLVLQKLLSASSKTMRKTSSLKTKNRYVRRGHISRFMYTWLVGEHYDTSSQQLPLLSLWWCRNKNLLLLSFSDNTLLQHCYRNATCGLLFPVRILIHTLVLFYIQGKSVTTFTYINVLILTTRDIFVQNGENWTKKGKLD